MSVFPKKGSPFLYYRFMVDGRRHTGSTGETNPYKAKQVEAEKIAAVRRGEIASRKGKMPLLSVFAQEFITYFERLVEVGQRSHKTLKCYQNGVRLLGTQPRVWKLRIHQITKEDAETMRFVGVDGQPLSASSTNNARRTLHCILMFAVERKLLRESNVPKFELLEENERQALMEPWIEDLILEFAPPKFRDAAILMLDTYMRPVEWSRMQWDDIRWIERRIWIPKSKTRKGRRFVGMSERVEHLLRVRLADAEAAAKKRPDGKLCPWVFPSRRAKSGHMMPGSIDKMWAATKVLMLKAIVERRLPPLPADLVPYSARHTGLTNFNMATGDLAKTARIAGHADIRTTQKYLHPETSDHAEMVNRHNEKKARLSVVPKRAS